MNAEVLMRRILLSFAAVAVVSLPALAQPTCPPRGGPMGMLTPEQRLMLRYDADQATADGSLSMQDYRAMERDKLKAMTQEQRQAWAADLTKRWTALTPAEQEKLKAEAAAFRKAHEGEWRGRDANCPPPPRY